MATPPDYAERERTILDALSAHIAVIDHTGKVLITNAAWRQFAGEIGDGGFSHPPVGKNYLAGCRKSGEQSAKAALAGLESVLQGKLPIFKLEFACHSPREPRWFQMSVTPLGGESGGAVISQEPIAPRLSLDGSAAGQPVVFGTDADSIWLVSVEDGEVFRFESVNDTFLQVTGCTREQVLHRRMEEWFPPGSLELVQAKYREVVKTRRPLHYEETTELPAGLRVGEISVVPILDADGQCRTLLGTAHDITARRQAEDALRASEERFALAVAGTDEGLWDWDLSNDAVFYAPRFKELLGYAPDDQRFPDTIASFRSHLHPEDVAPTEEAIRRAVQHGEPYRAAYRLRTARGEWRWFEARGATLRDAHGVATRMAGSITDITARRETEEALRTSEGRFRHLVESTRMIGWERPVKRLGFTYVSPWAWEALGYPLSDWMKVGFFHKRMVHPDDRKLLAQRNREAIGCADDFELEYRLVTADGRTLWFRDIVHVVRGAKGAEVLKGFLIDITARKYAETALRESEERFRRLVETSRMIAWEWPRHAPHPSYVADRAVEILGYPLADWYRDHFFKQHIVHPDDRQAMIDATKEGIRTRDDFELEYRLVTADGRTLWFQDIVHVVRTPKGQDRMIKGFLIDITTRKMAEAALRESEMRQRLAIEGGDLGLWDWNIPTGAFTVNDRWSEMLGHRREEIAPRLESWGDRCHPDDLAAARAAWADHCDGRTPAYEAEYRLRHKNGGWVWVLDKGRVVERDDDGQPLRACGTHLDITQRKEAEAAQRKSEERFRQVTETIDQVFWMTSVDKRRMLYVSPGYERIWGRTCQSLYAAPLTWLDSVHPEDRPHLIATATSQQATGAYDVDYRILRPDGTVRWIHDRAFPIHNAAGEVERIAGVAEDISRRKQVEEALRESRAILARAQELAHVGSYQFDVPFGQSSAWSAEVFRILGLDPASENLAPADYIARVVHPDDQPRVKREVERAVHQGKRYEADYRIVRPDGEVRHVHSVAEPVMGPDGQPRKFTGFLQCVTEQRRLEAELLEISDHEQQRIGQDLHDDLCQQLVGLEFRLEALQHELPEPSEARAELQRIGGLLRRATRHARTIAGALSPVPPDPHGLMDSLQSLASHSALLFRIECEYQCETPVFVADHTVAAHLYRIAQEAISNAFKHGHATRVLVTLADSVGEGHLTIEDNGSGCPLPIPPGQGMGTRIMHYRAGMIGATLHLEPAASGGLTVNCSFPLRTP